MDMKKVMLLFLVLVLTLPVAFAEIKLDALSRTEYNYGDGFVVSGFAKLAEDRRAYIDIDLVCNSEESQLFIRLLDLDAGVESPFSKLVTIPSDIAEDCKIVAKLEALDGTVIEAAESTTIKISGKLKGVFDVNSGVYQLGEKITLKGAITRLDGSPVVGTATMYFMKEGNKVFVESKNIQNGDLDVNLDLARIPPGAYSITVEVSDAAGNKHDFEDVATFEVIGGLNLDVNMDDQVYDPGEGIRVVGTIRSSVAENTLEGLELMIKLLDQKVTRKVTGNTFDVTINVPDKIKSGIYKMLITVKDSQGNYGERELDVKVGSVPRRLNIEMQRTEFGPDEKVSFTAYLYDQADELMSSDVMLKVIDPQKQQRAEQTISVNRKTSFDLPPSASPGGWSVEISGIGDLSASSPFIVKEVKKLDVILEDGKFKITNIGNVIYDEPLRLIAGDREYSQSIYLEPNQKGEIKLSDLFKEGVYDILIPGADKEFKGVTVIDDRTLAEKAGDALSGVTGRAGKTVTSDGNEEGGFGIGIILGLIVIFGLVLGGYFAYKRGLQVSDKTFTKDVESFDKGSYNWSKSGGVEIKPKKYVEPDRKFKFEFGKATPADVEDFKRRMVKTIEDDELKRKQLSRKQWVDDKLYSPSGSDSSGSQFGSSVEKKSSDDNNAKGMSSLFK